MPPPLYQKKSWDLNLSVGSLPDRHVHAGDVRHRVALFHAGGQAQWISAKTQFLSNSPMSCVKEDPYRRGAS